MSTNPPPSFAAVVAADPAVVSARPTKAKSHHHNKNHHKGEDHKDDRQFLPKTETPKSVAVRVKPAAPKTAAPTTEGAEQQPATEQPTELSFPEVDFTSHILIKTTADNEYVSIPRASASNIPGLTVPAAPTGDDAKSTPVIVEMNNLHSGAVIAINEWIEKKGATGTSTTTFTNPITYTEVNQVVSDEWEKEFSKGLLRTGEAIIGCINFAEKNNLKGLHQFAIVALSCALRGATAHEMASAMGHSENDSFTESEITAGRAAFPNVVAVANKRQ